MQSRRVFKARQNPQTRFFHFDLFYWLNKTQFVFFTFSNLLTARVVWAPQMISQPVSSIFLCSPLPSGTWQTHNLSIPWCCLPIFSSVCLVFFPLLLCLARWCWKDLLNGRHTHTTSVCVSLQCSVLLLVQMPAGSWHRLPDLSMRCVVLCSSTSFPWLVFFLQLCCEGPWFTDMQVVSPFKRICTWIWISSGKIKIHAPHVE